MGIKQNLGQLLKVIELQPIASVGATGNGTGVNIRDFDGELLVMLSAQNVSGTTPTLDCKLQHSDDDGASDAYADISGAAFTQVTDAGSKAAVRLTQTIRADQVKAFIRLVKTLSGSSSFLVSSHAIGLKQVES